MTGIPASPRPHWTAKRPVRWLISIAVVCHLWAVCGRPLEFATQGPFGSSPSASTFYEPVRAYSQFIYLDHGYAFFAPDPGPSHFIDALVRSADGERTQLKFPDLESQWPRLLYHRHFMLAEFLNDVHHPPGEPPQEITNDAIAAANWKRARRRYEDVRDSILAHLRSEYPRSEIAIRRVEHRQPGLPEFLQDRVDIRDPRLMRVLFDTIDGAPSTPVNDLVVPRENVASPPPERAP